MNALLAQFIPEARDLLEEAGAGMLALERDATSATAINNVFRAVHTLKGSSGLFDVGPLTRLVHAAEDLLDGVRTGDLALNSEIVDRLLESLDVLSRWIDALEARERLPSDAEATMTERVAALRAWLPENMAGKPVAAAQPLAEAPAWLGEMAEEDRLRAYHAVGGRALLAWSFDPEEDCFFRGDNPLGMILHSPGLLAFRMVPREALPAFDALDPLLSWFRFEVLSDVERDVLEDHMRYVAERVDARQIDASALAVAMGAKAKAPVFRDFARLARQHIAAGDREQLHRAISTLSTMAAPASLQGSALRWCRAVLECRGLEAGVDLERLLQAIESGAVPAGSTASPPSLVSPAPTVTSAKSAADRKLARAIALEQILMLETPASEAIAPGRIAAAARVLRNLAATMGMEETGRFDAAIHSLAVNGDLEPLRAFATSLGETTPATATVPTAVVEPASPPLPPPAATASALDGGSDGRGVAKVLRIDQSKIDSIMNLVAELIVAKNGLSYLATRAEQVHGSRMVAREIKDQFSVIDRITQGLQVGVMSVRMMPVGQVFQRFPRLVRDISRRLGKKVELIIEGEDTEADKNVLESLADPLIHMVRNSLDHGIEPPTDRLEAGKPEQGVLRISARHENDFVVIEVADDGKGIDPARVKTKARQLGLVSAEQADAMSDQEAVNLVFAAGFSTKDQVSDLSGRGVGMDVVRSTVVKAGGEVSLRSALGKGSTVTVRLPLTMAVTRIVTIDCVGRLFGIPMDSVVETVKIQRDQIHRIKSSEAFVLRDSIVPILRLARALQLPEPEAERDEEAVMVVRVGQLRCGIIVDGFRERLEVIVKPLEGVLEGMPGFSGTALMGDGRVLLILDLKELL